MSKRVIRRTRREVYQRWVKALRSGKYKQAENTLKSDVGFCCLGVLCDLARRDGGPEWESDRTGATYMGVWGILSDTFADFMGLEPHDQQQLATMNDDGATFEQIARRIETNFMKD